MMTLSDQIIAYASTLAEGSVLSPKDFLHLGNRAAIDKALSRLANEERLFRVDRGIYVSPVLHGRGIEPPAHKKILESLALQRGEIVTPDGASSAKALGLTHQAPVKESYITSGPSRKLTLGRYEIILEHAPFWMLALGTSAAGSAVRALAWLGPEKARESIEKLHRTLPGAEWLALASSRARLPTWMARAIGDEAVRG